jgi:aspartyl-tRNA synthetase
MERDLASDAAGKEGKKVTLFGFVNTRRDHGKIIFLDLRDVSGIVQIVATPKAGGAYKIAAKLGSEDVIKVIGTVDKRPSESVNPDIPTGKIEVAADEIELVNKAQALPIPIESKGYDIEEVTRFKYRHIDLRRERLQKNLKLRHQVTKLVREFLDKQGFVDIETPYLSKTTPEGARDFLVPSRLQNGKFYALAQSPQQYKQLLMISGVERYYQLARAFRDEDLRADRQFEHTQIDIEMAFVDRGDVMRLVEEMIIFAVEKSERKIDKKPFPALTYKDAKKNYNTDRPNLAKSKDKLHFLWVKDFPLLEKTEGGGFTFAHNPFASPKPEGVEHLKNNKNLENLQSLQYDLVCNGEEIGGGSIRITDPEIQRQVFRAMGYSDERIESEFGHILKAYDYGAPVHGGIALGLDRLVALIAGEDNIREVVAFPVTSSGQTSVMDAPSEAPTAQLKELGLRVVPPHPRKGNQD